MAKPGVLVMLRRGWLHRLERGEVFPVEDALSSPHSECGPKPNPMVLRGKSSRDRLRREAEQPEGVGHLSLEHREGGDGRCHRAAVSAAAGNAVVGEILKEP
jgi:hypothetical protein